MQGTRYKLRFFAVIIATMTFARGWEGDYGNELGSMVPWALGAMAVCMASGRRDWWKRLPICAMFAAIGGGFAGSLSYGIVLGYTQHAKFGGVLYGFACLFIIGFYYGAFGATFLGMALTQPRSKLQTYVGPIVAISIVWTALYWCGMRTWSEGWAPLAKYDVDWLAAISALVVAGVYWLIVRRSEGAKVFTLLALGWIVGFGILTLGLGLRMTPPRSDQWAGITGMFVVLFAYLYVNRLRAVRRLMAYAGVFGGFGFAIGAILLSLQGAYHWPVNGWRFMEQFFGLLMGVGLAIGALKLATHHLAPGEEDAPLEPLNSLAIIVLYVGMIGMNLWFNIYEWLECGQKEAEAGRVWTLSPEYYGISVYVWFGTVAVLAILVLLWAMRRHRRQPFVFVPEHPLGRGQLLYLVMLWICVAAALSLKASRMANPGQFHSQFTFGAFAILCTLFVLDIPGREITLAEWVPASDDRWRLGSQYWLIWATVPVVLLLLTKVAVAIHPEPLGGSHYRFEYKPADE